MCHEARHLHNGWRVAAPFKDVQLAAGDAPLLNGGLITFDARHPRLGPLHGRR